MAGHLPIATTKEHRNLVKELVDRLKSLNFFIKIHCPKGGYFMRLDDNYRMDEEHGLKDDEIFSYTPAHGEYILEIHLDSDKNINQVYKVL